MLKIGIVSNVYARIVKSDPNYNTRLWYCLGNKGHFEVTKSLTELEEVCKDFKLRGINLIGIVGGDGTVSLVLSYIYKIYGPQNLPKILLLKSGTINFLASNLDLKRPALETLKRFLELESKGVSIPEKKYYTLLVNNQRLGFVYGSGLISAFLSEFYKNKKGPLKAITHAGKLALDALFWGKINGNSENISRSYPMKITTKPESFSTESYESYNLILASTVPKLAFGFHLFRNIDTNIESAQLMTANVKKTKLVGLLKNIVLGADPTKFKGVGTLNFNSLEITSPEEQFVSLDGDLIELPADKKNTLSIGPQFTFCVPD